MTPDATLYEALAAPFETTFHDTRGGATFEYLTGEQVTTRLNTVLGPFCWSFKLLEHGINEQADEVWCLGELTATNQETGEQVIRQQFGSQKLKRARKDSSILDIGFDLKGAATDAMKKCASLIGVGLYLSAKEIGANGKPQQAQTPESPALICATCQQPVVAVEIKGRVVLPTAIAEQSRTEFDGKVLCFEHYSAARKTAKAQQPTTTTGPACWRCGATITDATFADKSVWGAQKVADYTTEHFGRPLCTTHWQEARKDAGTVAS